MTKRRRDKQPPKTKKYFRSTKSGAGMTKAGVAKYRRDNPGSKLKTAVTKKKNLTAKEKARRKSFKARHAKNIKKGKMSAAYWANRVKWSPSKTKSPSKKWKKGS